MRQTIQSQPNVSPDHKILFALAGASSTDGWVALAPVAVPHVCQVADDMLLWADLHLAQYGAALDGKPTEVIAWTPERTVRLSRKELDAFVAIKTIADARRLAAGWGPLRICKHGIPGAHLMTETVEQTRLLAMSRRTPTCRPIGYGAGRVLIEVRRALPSGHVQLGRYGKEPLEFWVQFAKEAQALLSLAARLRRGDDIDAAQLNPLWAAVTVGNTKPWTRRTTRADEEFGWLAYRLEQWLVWGGVRLRPVISQGQIRPAISTTGLAGGLAAMLFAAICGGKALTLCSECAVPFIATRIPARGLASYCRDCGPAASGRAASRRWDAKNPGRSHHAKG